MLIRLRGNVNQASSKPIISLANSKDLHISEDVYTHTHKYFLVFFKSTAETSPIEFN